MVLPQPVGEDHARRFVRDQLCRRDGVVGRDVDSRKVVVACQEGRSNHSTGRVGRRGAAWRRWRDGRRRAEPAEREGAHGVVEPTRRRRRGAAPERVAPRRDSETGQTGDQAFQAVPLPATDKHSHLLTTSLPQPTTSMPPHSSTRKSVPPRALASSTPNSLTRSTSSACLLHCAASAASTPLKRILYQSLAHQTGPRAAWSMPVSCCESPFPPALSSRSAALGSVTTQPPRQSRDSDRENATVQCTVQRWREHVTAHEGERAWEGDGRRSLRTSRGGERASAGLGAAQSARNSAHLQRLGALTEAA